MGWGLTGLGARAPLREHALVVFGYAWLTAIFTYPLIRWMTVGLPGDGIDGSLFLWDDWWVQWSLAHGGSIFRTDRIFYPQTVSLLFHTHTALNGVLAWPLTPLFGLVGAHNAVLFGSFVVSGYGTYWLVRRAAGAGRAASFVGGVVFAFCPYKLAHLLGHVNLTSTEYIPLFALFVLRAFGARTARGAIRDAAVAAIFWACSLYTEYTYALFTAAFAALFSLYRLAQRPRAVPYAAAAATLIAGAAIAVLPIAWTAHLDLALGEHLAVPARSGAEDFSAALVSYAMPSPLHPLLARWSTRSLRVPPDLVESTVFLGWSVMAVAAVGALRGPRRWRRDAAFWAALTLVFVTLSLGPRLNVAGAKSTTRLPYALLQRMPLVKNARAPGRFAAMAALGCAVLAGAGISHLSRRARSPWRRGSIAAGMLGVVGFEYFAAPIPFQKLEVPRVYERIAADPGDGVLLDIPLGWRDGFHVYARDDASARLFQTVHTKRTFGGMVARLAEGKADVYREMPVVSRIVALQEPGAAAVVPNGERARVCDFLRTHDLAYVVVRAPLLESSAHAYVRDYLPLEPLDADARLAAYRVQASRCTEAWIAGGPFALGLSDSHDVHFGEGWSWEEHDSVRSWRWMGPRSTTTIALPRSAARRLRVVGRIPLELVPWVPTLRFSLDGVLVALVSHTDGGGGFAVELEVPAGAHDAVVLTIESSLTGSEPGDARPLGVAVRSLEWTGSR